MSFADVSCYSLDSGCRKDACQRCHVLLSWHCCGKHFLNLPVVEKSGLCVSRIVRLFQLACWSLPFNGKEQRVALLGKILARGRLALAFLVPLYDPLPNLPRLTESH